MDQHFTHLHLHTEFSLLDGAISIERLIQFYQEHQFKAVAITDHGNIFGAVKLFQHAKKANLKPILGMEAYFTEDIQVKNAQNKYYHLIIIVENEIGYKNLCQLIKHAYTDGFYFKPRIDYALLKRYAEGLIVTSACLGGHIPTLLMNGQESAAHERISWFLDVFGTDRFYLEIQPEDLAEQKILNQKIFEISKQTGASIIATGDCHYVTKEDRESHEIMLAIQTHHKLTDPDRFTFGDCRVHIRTTEEMLSLFPEHPEAVWNSGRIADRCSFEFTTNKLFFPTFPLPQEITQEEYFTHLCESGLEELFKKGRIPTQGPENTKKQDYKNRLATEMQLIIQTGFVGYFLVVSDFIQWAKKQNIPVGPGRGSAAGSLVAWALQITDIDPIAYNLLFERFLNPERISMPDIDIDFCIEGRDKVIQYVRSRYGHDHVCQIITFGTMLAKGAIKDVARVLGFPFEDSNRLTDLIPDQLKITLKEALANEPKLRDMLAQNPNVAHLFNIACRLEGLTRHASKHAAGIVITPEPVHEMLPIYIPPKTTDLVTQYAMTELESLGFLKMDFLGLKNLTLIDRTVKSIAHHYNIHIDIVSIPLNDQKTFDLLCHGKTLGVFQLESSGLQDVLRRLQPNKFEDIIAVNALYRPGPLGSGMVDDFIARRHGEQTISYIFPELESILAETYGVIVYQEQVMKIASTIAGFSLGESDILRRAMGKKKADIMAEQKKVFVDRAIQRSFDAKKSEELFDLMAYFSGYGFNKSHSAAYALIAYQTAYLKANYTAQFMACLISLEASDTEKMSFYLTEARDMGIPIFSPDINSSDIQFRVIDQSILFGLQGIKNVGQAALDEILQQRSQEPFIDLLDFCTKIDLRTVNKRVIESLICAGAFDSLPGYRSQKYEALSHIIDCATEKKRARETGQLGLFTTSLSPQTLYEFLPPISSLPEWSTLQKLEREKEVMGLYLSGHPLDSYVPYLSSLPLHHINTIQTLRPPSLVVCGIVKHMKTITTKKGTPMCFLVIEDYTAKIEIVIFPKLYERIHQWLATHTTFVVKGEINESSETCKINASDIIPLDLIINGGHSVKEIVCELPDLFSRDMINNLKQHTVSGTIPFVITFTEHTKQLQLKSKVKCTVTSELLHYAYQNNIKIQLLL